MRKPRGNKYAFPTRILARAQGLLKNLLKTRSLDKTNPHYSEFFLSAFDLAQELLLLRLLEQNWILEEGWLKEQIQAKDLSVFFNRLKEFNHLLGIELFKPDLVSRIEVKAEEIFEFVGELYQAKYLPAKAPPELISALVEKLGLMHPEQAPFFTPLNLVQMMVNESFSYLGWEEGRLEDKEFMILDPSFGAGNFLLGILRKMISVEENYYAHRPSGLFYPLIRLPDLSRSIEVELRIELCRKHLFGLELSEQGQLSAFRALSLVLLCGKKITELAPGALSFLEKNFARGDFLVDQPIRQQIGLFESPSLPELQPFNFQDENYPHHHALKQGGFDLVIGNPPWLSLKGKQALHPYSPEVIEYLITRFHADSYRPNLFEMFIQRGMELTKPGGINCFLVPDRLAENLQFQPLREAMIREGEILRLHFREPFPGVISDTLIYWLRKKPGGSARKIPVTDAQGKKTEISVKRFLKKGGALVKESSEQESALLEKIRREAKGKLSDYLNSGVGLIARAGTIHSERHQVQEQELIKGENVQAWQTTGHYFFEFHPHNLIGGTTRYSKLTAPERILVRKTGSRLIATIDRSKRLVEQSVYFLIPKPGRKMKYKLEYFLALLNSDLLNFYYRHYLVTNPGSTPQLKKFHLDQLPVKRLNLKDLWEKESYLEIIELVEKISQTQNPEQRKKLEQKLNLLIFDLHHLDAKERQLISSTKSA